MATQVTRMLLKLGQQKADDVGNNFAITGTPPVPLIFSPGLNSDMMAHLPHSEGQESIEQVLDALKYLDPDCDRDVWLKVCWAGRHGLGDTVEALDLFIKWSRGELHNKEASQFTCEQDVLDVWNSYDSTRDGGITVSTLYHFARLNGWQVSIAAAPTTENITDCTPGDIANGKLFASLMQDRLIFNPSRTRWMHYAGGVFNLCERGEEMAAAKGVAEKLLAAVFKAIQAKGADDPKVKKWSANAMRVQLQKGLEAMLELAKSEPGMSVPMTAFDADPMLLCVRNGVLDLKRGILIAHDPKMLLTRRAEADYLPDATCRLFEKFISDIFDGDGETGSSVQRYLGYSLTGDVSEEKLAFAYGSGANGKSVLANVLTVVLGTYCMTAPASMLEVQGNNSGPRPDLARLAGARLVLANETNEGKAWDSQTVKQIVSTERLATRFLYSDYFEYQPTAKVIVRGNHKPTIHDSGDGMWRRVDLWPFERQFAVAERDTRLLEKLLAERDGILAWMVRGCSEWQRSGLKQSQKISDASLSYRKDCDVIGQWLTDQCELAPAYVEDTGTLYNSYRMWSESCGLRTISKQAFGRKLPNHGLASITSNSVRKVQGVRIRRGKLI